MSDLYSPADLAAKFGGEVTEAKVLEWRRTYRWPSIKVGKTIRFTAAQVEQILASHEVRHEAEAATVVEVAGQTSRSASRRRSA